MSFVANPSFLCVRATANEVMWPCICSGELSSSLHGEMESKGWPMVGALVSGRWGWCQPTFLLIHSPQSCHRSLQRHTEAEATRECDKSNTAKTSKWISKSSKWSVGAAIIEWWRMVRATYFECIVFGKAQQVCSLHLQQVFYSSLSNAHHSSLFSAFWSAQHSKNVYASWVSHQFRKNIYWKNEMRRRHRHLRWGPSKVNQVLRGVYACI